MRPNGIVTLTSDFGLTDSYVSVLKGVILGIAPETRLIDTTHSIRPQNIHQAAYIVDTFYRHFPPGSIHLVVVDPGAGSGARAIALETPEAFFLAPDNGVLTFVWLDALARWGAEQCTVVRLTDRRYWLSHVSNTFHGRDILAPVAGHILRGASVAELGERLLALSEATLEQPGLGRNGELVGRIIHVDHFGNCITNIAIQHIEAIAPFEQLRFKVIDQHIPGLRRTYAESAAGTLLALVGSSGRIEIAVSHGHAAQTLGVGIGDTVRVFATNPR
jgi:S-adenosylmethionine hydrolase